MELLLGYIPEAIYFALFMIYTKQLKEKRLLYITLMVLEYLLLKQFVHFSIYFQVAYTFITFVILKILYREKAQIIDIFTFTIASIFLIITSVISFLISGQNVILATIINRIIIFVVLFGFNYKLNVIQNLYKKLWNRNDKVKKKIKTTTFRSLNVIIFNVIFYFINVGMVYAIYYNSK